MTARGRVAWRDTPLVVAARAGHWLVVDEVDKTPRETLSALTQFAARVPFALPDGRLVFSTSRLGARDEYHGYPATGLAVKPGLVLATLPDLAFELLGMLPRSALTPGWYAARKQGR